MIEILKEKLEKLSIDFEKDSDIISLKALCLVKETEKTKLAIEEILKRLEKKYPFNEEILDLLSNEKSFSLEEVIERLEKRYPDDIEVTTIKALYNLPNSEEKENAIKECLRRMIKSGKLDKGILSYLEMNKMPRHFVINFFENVCLEQEKKRREMGIITPEEQKFNVDAFKDSPAGKAIMAFEKSLTEKLSRLVEEENEKYDEKELV